MTDLSANFGGLLGFGILAAALIFFAKAKRFFDWVPSNWNQSIYLWIPLLFFGIYFIPSVLIIRTAVPWISQHVRETLSICALFASISFTQLFAFFIVLFLLSPQIRIKIWKDPTYPGSFWSDLKAACIGWLISFAVLSFVGNLIQLLLFYLFHITHIPDQAAVAFVKRSLKDPSCFPLLFTTIAISTPIVEELLFRGGLQSFIRKHLGSKSAIWITAVCFSFFHYTPEQNVANVVIVSSLFPLALILGYLYEKQRSLASPILLHSLFNGANLFALLFFGETICGPV